MSFLRQREERQRKFRALALDGNLDEISELYLSGNIQIDSVSPFGQSALHFACMAGKEPVVRFLLANGANRSLKDYGGLNRVGDHFITLNGDIAQAEDMRKAAAKQQTPSDLAKANGFFEIVKLLDPEGPQPSNTTVVKYSEHIPSNPDFKITEIDVKNFSKSFGFTWEDWVCHCYNTGAYGSFSKLLGISEEAARKMQQEMISLQKTLVVCNMGSDFGSGLFLSTDAAPILEGTLVGVYTGQLHHRKNSLSLTLNKEECDLFCMFGGESIQIELNYMPQTMQTEARRILKNIDDALLSKELKFKIDVCRRVQEFIGQMNREMGYDVYDVSMSCSGNSSWQSIALTSKRVGNLMRYVFDAPSETELCTVREHEGVDLSKVARENLDLLITGDSSIPFCFLKCKTTINPGEMLTFSYGWDFWAMRPEIGKRTVFDRLGNRLGYFENPTKLCLVADLSASNSQSKCKLKP
jgi:hypothetical protein